MSKVNIPHFSGHASRVLIVDDERMIRLLIKRTIQGSGYQIQEAADGLECLKICQERVPDLILLDAMMPNMDGFNCCIELQKACHRNCPPILMITALDDDDSINRAFDSGAIDYITKPLNLTVLRHRVRRLLQMNWAMSQLQRLTLIDELTQLANRRHFDNYIDQIIDQHSSHRETQISLVLCDIDRFKKINDTYGHLVGDYFLKAVASVIGQSLKRPMDLAARYGGEEFGLILPDTSLEEAIESAEAIRSAVKSIRVHHQEMEIPIKINMSFGVSCISPSILSKEELISRADAALYQAKNEGRDRVVARS